MALSIEEAREFFSGDCYATALTGIDIVEVGDHYSKCCLALDGRHKNAAGQIMGGVPYTLADFAFAVATNSGKDGYTVTVTGNISYLSICRGNVLTAECTLLREGRRNCFYHVDIKDETGTLVAVVNFSGAHIAAKSPVSD